MVKVLLGIIIFVFVLYFGSMGGRQRAEAIATLDGKIISRADFDRQYHDVVELYRQRFGGILTEEMLRALDLKRQVLDKMVDQAILMKKAEELGIKVTPEELRSSITSIPTFQRNGVFDEALYQRMLRYNRMKPEEFEAMQRQTMTVLKLESIIVDGVHVADQEVYDYFLMRNAKVNLTTCHLSPQGFIREVNITQADLERYLKEHGEAFRVPTQVKVRYILFSPQLYSDQVTVSPQEVAEYRQSLGSSGAKTMTDDKIAFEIKKIKGMRRAYEEAKKAHDEIYQSENFDAYVAKHRLPVKTTDYFTEANPPAELSSVKDLTKTVFALQRNEISRVITTNDGYLLLAVADRKESHVPPLSAVAEEVRKRYVMEEARKRALKEAEALIAQLKKGIPSRISPGNVVSP